MSDRDGGRAADRPADEGVLELRFALELLRAAIATAKAAQDYLDEDDYEIKVLDGIRSDLGQLSARLRDRLAAANREKRS